MSPATLNTYVFELQRILHDAAAQTWPVSPDLIYYINKGRDTVALDTFATRILPQITLVPQQDRYQYALIQQSILTMNWSFTGGPPPSRGVATIVNINCIQSSAYQPPLVRMAWSELNLRYRQAGPTNPSSFPEAWAPFDDNYSFFIEFPPGTALNCEIDCTYLPTNLVNLTDVDTAINDPLSNLVPLAAARFAMYYMDEQDTALVFWSHYLKYRDELCAQLPGVAGFSINQ